MSHLWRARCVLLLSCFSITALLSNPDDLPAQSPAPTGTVTGYVADPSGARLPHALIHVQGTALSRDLTSDALGNFTAVLPLGDYDLTIAAPGFAATTTPLHLVDATPARLSIPLRIAVKEEAIAVPIDGAASNSANDNASAIVFQSSDLNAFSNDDATFQKELLSLAGGLGQGPSVFIDGFSGGRFPPKNTIASIRINRNPYSALYDSLGFGRVQVSTRPGGEKLYGELDINATESRFNAPNPYITAQPPYYILNLSGNLSGSIDKKTAFFVNGIFNDQQNNAALNAIMLDSANQPVSYAAAVRDPQMTSTFGLRLDRTVTSTNNLTGRYEFNQITQTNGGLTALLTTADQAFNSGTTSQTLQLSDTQTIGAHLLYESRFQYVRTRLQQNAVSSVPTLVVEGSFNGGGNPSQSVRDNQDRFEFQQSLAVDRGPHFLRFGARYRLQRDANLSTANYNGQFTFPSLAAFAAHQPSQFSITSGQSSASVLTGDLGAYAEDEWRVTKSITLDLGFRLESQSAIPDHLDPSPHFGAAWALHRKGKKPTFLTLRTGGAIFYGRFLPADLLTAIRQNGVSQQTFILNNPSGYPQLPSGVSLTATQPTIYRLAPNLTSQYGWSGGFSVEKSIPRVGNISLNYVDTRGVHQFITRNINAPLPGTYNPAVPTSGTRPFGGMQNIYEFDSNGIEKTQILFLSTRLTPAKGLVVFCVYDLVRNNTNANGTNSFPSNSYNLSADYGPAVNDQPQQSFFGGSYNLPHDLSLNLYGSFQSGLPYNITTGTDLNGDSIFNDRPAFATAPTANSVLYKTRFGTLDANPQPGEAIIPSNYGRSPSFVYLDLSVSKGFNFGPRPPTPAAAAGKPAPPPGDRPYGVIFTVDATNVLNHRNPGPPVGVLTSPYFGQSLTLNSVFSPNTASNRVIFLQAAFHF